MYGKGILQTLKDTIYDITEMKCLLLELEDDNKTESLKADKMMADQFLGKKISFITLSFPILSAKTPGGRQLLYGQH